MRIKYSQEFENDMYKLASTMTLNELLCFAKNKYKYKDITKRKLQLYLSKRKIRYKDYKQSMVRQMGLDYAIGSEYVKDDGMTLVKVAKDKWEYKQRLIYSQYHNVKLTNDDYIIFLDQDRTNFDINNLKKVTKHESSILANQHLFSKNPLITETGIQIAKLMIKTKDKEEKYGTNNNSKRRNNIQKKRKRKQLRHNIIYKNKKRDA